MAWVALTEFAQTSWKAMRPDLRPEWPAGIGLTGPVNWAPLNAGEIPQLLIAAQNERADALGEIGTQSNEFLSYFMNMMTAKPGAYPQTFRVLTIASLVATFVAMFWKNRFKLPRPSQLSPALLPRLEVPGHQSFPSGHSGSAWMGNGSTSTPRFRRSGRSQSSTF